MTDMKWIVNGIKRLVTAEVANTIRSRGYFVDDHQAIAVIQEEYEEVLDEINHFRMNKETLWSHIKADSDDSLKLQIYDKMRIALQKAAAELIQTAAMCEKAMCSIEERSKENDNRC